MGVVVQRIEDLMRQCKFAEAQAEADKAVLEQPTNPRLHALKGLALFRQGHFAEAVESFERATILDPQFWEAHLKLAQSLDRLQRYEEALQAAQAGHLVQPNDRTLELLLEGLSRIAKPTRTDGWERSVHLDHYHVELTHDN